MRFYKKYCFAVGRKIELKDLFAVIDSFLAQQGLSYGSLGYDFLTLQNGCHKLTQKMPRFGPVEVLEGRYNTMYRLSNMKEQAHPCDEASIRLVGTKIPRPYNFMDITFFYRGIPFFGVEPEKEHLVFTPDRRNFQVWGSYIALGRGFEGPKSTTVSMCIPVTDHQSCLASNAYARTLSGCLLNTRYTEMSDIYMDETEQAEYVRIKETVMPLMKTAKDDLNMRAEQVREQLLQEFSNVEPKSFNLSAIMLRIGKKHGFDQCTSMPGGPAYISKAVGGGRFLSVEYFGSRGSGFEAGLVLSGPGIYDRIVNFSGAPENSAEAQWHIDHMLSLADYFETEYLGKILEQYPQTPDWCPMILLP